MDNKYEQDKTVEEKIGNIENENVYIGDYLNFIIKDFDYTEGFDYIECGAFPPESIPLMILLLIMLFAGKLLNLI